MTHSQSDDHIDSRSPSFTQHADLSPPVIHTYLNNPPPKLPDCLCNSSNDDDANVDVLPRVWLAPMVWGSELAFRMMCRSRGGVLGLCYTPMLRSDKLLAGDKDELYLLDETCVEDSRSLVVQLCGSDPSVLASAGRLVVQRTSGNIVGIDLNLGCPKECAQKGGYGAFLVGRDVNLAAKCVSALCNAVHPIPVSCKIRIAEEGRDATVEIALRMQNAGASWIVLHCRKRDDNTRTVLPDYDLGREVVKALSVPVVLNGGVDAIEQARDILHQTGCSAVMAATGFLRDPLFLTEPGQCPGKIASCYLDFCELYPPPSPLYIRRHFRWIFRNDLQPDIQPDTDLSSLYKDWRPKLWTFLVRPYLENIAQFRAVVVLYLHFSGKLISKDENPPTFKHIRSLSTLSR